MGTRARTVLVIDDGEAALFLRIARAVADDVRRGRLRAGEALPGTRVLAASLGVNRNTVVAAYNELVAEGWAASRPGGGTFVGESVPEPRPRASVRQMRPSSIVRALPYRMTAGGAPPLATPYPRGALVMAGSRGQACSAASTAKSRRRRSPE